MTDRELLLGVLATQVGFATPAQVMAAASAHFSARDGRSLLDHLVDAGALTPDRKATLQALADQALRGDAVTILQDEPGRTIDPGASTPPTPSTTPGNGESSNVAEVPLERPEQYRRLDELGRGGQSVVWRALDRFVGREVAMKELTGPPHAGAGRPGGASIQRFLREARLVASLDHPGIVPVLELVRRPDGTLVCVQKLVVGETLKARFAGCRRLEDRLQLLPHLIASCQAVGYAHAHGVVHRDLKPSNIMVGRFGQTVVVDWGLAKRIGDPEGEMSGPAILRKDLTVVGSALGTPEYMSPEQASGEVDAIDERTDVFNLGGILFELLAGRSPYEGASSEDVLSAVREGRRASLTRLEPRAPRELVAVAEQALALDPQGRYANAEALAIDLAAYVAGGRVRAYRYSRRESVRRFISQHRALTTGVAVALVALCIVAGLVGLRLRDTRISLAAALLQRARSAEQESDFAGAAAFFAASRVQHDTKEARWGTTLALARAPTVAEVRRGPSGALLEVGFLPDGRAVRLSLENGKPSIVLLDNGSVLWSGARAPVLAAALLPGSTVRFSVPDGWDFHDLRSGALLHHQARRDGRPCPGPTPPRAAIVEGQVRVQGSSRGPLAEGVEDKCVVSDDGRLAGAVDTSGRTTLSRLEDGKLLASASSTVPIGFIFTAHGLAFRDRSALRILKETGDRLQIQMPQWKGSNAFNADISGSAVTPDGRIVAMTRTGDPRVEVIDVDAQVVIASLRPQNGGSRLAFSTDGRSLWAANLQNATLAVRWNLPIDPRSERQRGLVQDIGYVSQNGKRILARNVDHPGDLRVIDVERGEIARLSTRVHDLPDLSPDGNVLVLMELELEDSWVSVRDLESQKLLARRPCSQCRKGSVSNGAARLLSTSPFRVEVWDVEAGRVVFEDTKRVPNLVDRKPAISSNGRRIAWSRGATVWTRELETGAENEIDLETPIVASGLDAAGQRLVICTARGLELWDLEKSRLSWRRESSELSLCVDPVFTVDGGAIAFQLAEAGSGVLDARTGETLISMVSSNDTNTRWRSLVLPDLRHQILEDRETWSVVPLPEPDTRSPEASLSETLKRTGLRFEGTDLVAAH